MKPRREVQGRRSFRRQIAPGTPKDNPSGERQTHSKDVVSEPIAVVPTHREAGEESTACQADGGNRRQRRGSPQLFFVPEKRDQTEYECASTPAVSQCR